MTISSYPSARTEPGNAPDPVALAAHYHGAEALPLLRAMVEREFPGGIALVSSFGSESAVLLDMVARIDRALPVLFLRRFGQASMLNQLRPERSQDIWNDRRLWMSACERCAGQWRT